MNKIKFEAFLRDKLAVLQQSEIDEIINEYLQHIDMRTAEGLSEEEAIKDFGDLNILVMEILDAYKIDTKHNEFEDFSNTFKKWLNKALDYINIIANSIMSRSGREIVSLIIEFILIIILLAAISWTIDIVFNNFIRLFYNRLFVFRFMILLAELLKIILNLTISLSILYWFANERIIKFESKTSVQTIKPKVVMKQKKDSKDNIIQRDEDLTNDNKPEAVKSVNIEAEKSSVSTQASEKSFGQMLFDGNLLIIRVIMLVVLIPMIVVGVFLGIAFVTIVYNTIIGFGSLGLSITLSGVILIYFYILTLMIQFVSGGK